MVWTLVLPTLFEEVIEFFPLFELENGFEFQFHDLKVLGDDIGLSRSAEFFYAIGYGLSKFLAAFAGFKIVLKLPQSVATTIIEVLLNLHIVEYYPQLELVLCRHTQQETRRRQGEDRYQPQFPAGFAL